MAPALIVILWQEHIDILGREFFFKALHLDFLLSVSIVCQDFFSLVLTVRYNEFQAAQRRLLRYISLRPHMFL